ncbi:unnamed protein product [Fusarium fujikuroi]|nr:unnamed protein product [Fusarium fujikuroi]
MAAIKNIALITTSTRKSRVGPQITSVINDILTGDADASKNTKISLVDVANFNLPVFNEEIMPAMVPDKGSFKHAHSIAWSNEIKKYDGYIFVIPEYNFGLAGGTKNAVDYLYNEWIGKGVLIISYGIFGGNSASEQLDKTLKGMKLNVVDTRPALGFHGGDIVAETPTILKAFGELKDLMDKQVPKDSQK